MNFFKSITDRLWIPLILSGMLFLLLGCGQTGPLSLPTDDNAGRSCRPS